MGTGKKEGGWWTEGGWKPKLAKVRTARASMTLVTCLVMTLEPSGDVFTTHIPPRRPWVRSLVGAERLLGLSYL